MGSVAYGRFRIRISEDVDYSIINMKDWRKAKFKLFSRDFLIVFNKHVSVAVLGLIFNTLRPKLFKPHSSLWAEGIWCFL